MESLTASYSGLSVAASKFKMARASLDEINEENQGSDVLIPLTSSMYVPGKLADVSSVLVDVGTGYFVEKDVPAAKAFFEAKETFLRDQSQAVAQQLEQKQEQHNQIRYVFDMLNARAQAQAAQQAKAQ